MPDVFELSAILAKSLLYFGVFTAAGLVTVRFVFAPLVHEILTAIQRFAFFCSALGLVAALTGFALRGAALTGDASGITDPTILGMMWQTPVGSALSFRIAGLGLMMLGLLLGGFAWVLALVGAVGALWSFSAIGHVADDALIWTKVVLFVHLAVVSFWIGILFPLGKLADQAQTLVAARELGHRFGQIASAIIPLLLLAGVLLSWKLVGSWNALFATSYGVNLLAKLAIVAGLLLLGALNKFRIVPRLVAGDPKAGKSLAKALKIEWLAFVLVLVVTSALTTLFAIPMK